MSEQASNVPQIFDRGQLHARFEHLAGVENFYIDHLIEDALERLGVINRNFDRVLAIVPDVDAVAGRFEGVERFGTVDVISLFDDPTQTEELTAPGRNYDLVLSVGCLQVINDLPGMLAQIKAHLMADGLFLGAMMGGASLFELRQSFLHAEIEQRDGAAPRVAPFVDVRDAGALLQRAGYALPVSDVDRLTIRYDGMIGLVQELKKFGASNPLVARDPRPMTRSLMALAAHHYHDQYADADSRIRATVETIWMSGWVPHESQQKPMKPGTAKMRLADALKVNETKL